MRSSFIIKPYGANVFELTLHEKLSFPLRISSVNVTKSAVQGVEKGCIGNK